MTWTIPAPTLDTIRTALHAIGRIHARRAGVALLAAASCGGADTSRVAVTPPPPASEVGDARAPTTHYVAPDGRGANPGTRDAPWDLATALAGADGRVQPGDTVRIRGGTYADGGRLSVSGSAGAPIVFDGYPGETATIRRQFRGEGSWVVIQGLVFAGPIDGRTNQVYLHDCHDVVFTRNEIRDGDYHAGLSVDDAHHVTITANFIHDNGVDTSHDHGIYFKTTRGGGSVIANNVIVHNAARGISLHDNSGEGVFDVLVAHNTIVGNGSTGILVNDGDRVTVANNVVADNGARTGQRQIRVLAGDANHVVDNLTWDAGRSARADIENTTRSEARGNRVADPRFRSATDFRPRPGSPAIDFGHPTAAVTTDYAGAPRDSRPDAGAFEYRP